MVCVESQALVCLLSESPKIFLVQGNLYCSLFFIGILKGCIFLQLVVLLVFAQFFLWTFQKNVLYHSGHSACVCLLSKTFSIQEKPFHFLSALTSTFACNFRSGDLSALACIRKKIVMPNRCSIGSSSMYTFRSSKLIFRNFWSMETRGS